ncbi:glycosyltransferase involved in cell wall biosynthesis [Pedobacter sp. AK017]|uniref:glycosyltransferase family 2 protein n=1 Tax=Pedobacter sp. AK017 TaxID=2723073 RepID=UPI00160C3991|nr:glycosyltransferase family 2 protein [Pedobacter sp. AK017]MBB5436376.1 glycosyltransferase involved in cell wall biosynthesis [Pedobacter sp. AK017]
MTLFSNPSWINDFEFNYTKLEEVPQEVFDNINKDLDLIIGENPLVTVLISAWNEEINILRCLGSLSKTKANFPIEIIVVNNNSKDRTQDTIDKLHVTGLFEQKQGCGPARQFGQENAKGKYVLLADADCIYPPCWVTEMTKILSKPNIVCVYGRYSFISEPGFPRWKLFVLEKMKDVITEFRQLNRPYFNAYGLSMGYVHELGLKVGFIETNFWGDDGQLCLGLMKYGKVRQVRSNKARVWTGPRTLQRDGNLSKAFLVRIKKELKRFFRNFDSKLPEDATHESKSQTN